jgi:epoxyqueuosine reductase
VTPAQLQALVKTLAREQGLDACGITHAEAISRSEHYRAFLAAGFAGTMHYLHEHVDKRLNATRLLPGARSVIVTALLYHQRAPSTSGRTAGDRGRVAMYAWGDDYHRVIKRKLFALVDALRAQVAAPFEAKVCVDTAPLLEREYAMRAGVGWIGKNTLVLNERLGSYVFLGCIVTTLAIASDPPAVDHCGSCTRCLEACPTQAFPGAYRMNASQCISYLTIEHRAPHLPLSLAGRIGDWVFGCDVCQEVCPFNREAPITNEPRFAVRPPGPSPLLTDLLAWSDEEYRRQLAGSAVKRAKPDMLRRNARTVRANQRRDEGPSAA